MKRNLIIIMSLMSLLIIPSIISADVMQIRVEPLDDSNVIQPNTEIDYEWRFSLDNTCKGEILNISDTITTDAYGRGYTEADVSLLTDEPAYVCEYKDEVLRVAHQVPSAVFDDVFVYGQLYSRGDVIVGGDLSVTGDGISLKNDEEITNDIDGTILFTAPYVNTSSHLSVEGSLYIKSDDTAPYKLYTSGGDAFLEIINDDAFIIRRNGDNDYRFESNGALNVTNAPIYAGQYNLDDGDQGQGGQYWAGTGSDCVFTFSGGIFTGTNCTAVS